jgi:acetoin utilization deacetylase AcuC-like enzyme/acyl-CoA hydrolase/ribosomal protein S18 acetylase RimI-like enzyme
MAAKKWQEKYKDKLTSAIEALTQIKNGQTIFVGSGAGEPSLLTWTLSGMAPRFWDIEVIHLTAAQERAKLVRPDLQDSFRYNTFYIGRGISAAVAEGRADYTPMNVRELPSALEDGTVMIDVALVQVSPPNSKGMCSLGVSVDATKAAMENAGLVIAQVNENMPVTCGESMVSVDDINFLVEGHAPLIEEPSPEIDPVSLTIGRHIADIISDGMTLHFDREPICAATMRYLDTKRDLGIHTDILTDDIWRLIKSKAVTNKKKKINVGKTVATMVMGTKKLYDGVNGNPAVEIYPIDVVNDSFVISQNDNMVSIHSIHEIELTGLARADNEEISQIRSLPSGHDFVNGANRSKGGFSIVALPSTTSDGKRSRIVALSVSGAVSFSRSRVHYVVTEYGVVNLYGLSLRERAIALISIAHPKFRKKLLEDAKKLHYVNEKQVIPPETGGVYPGRYSFKHTFRDKTEVKFRPVQPSDARRIQRMFYHLTPQDIRMRYHGTLKMLSAETAQRMAAVDYSQDMSIAGFVGPKGNPQMIAEARYMYNPANNMGEFDIQVHKDYRGKGIGVFLANYLKKIAYARGLSGLYAEVIQQNESTMGLLNKAWPNATKHFESGIYVLTFRFPQEALSRPKDSIIVYSGRFGDYSYGDEHPFDPKRARTTMRLIKQEGFLDEPWMRVEEVKMITKEKLIESHSPEYIDALEKANSGEWNEEFLKFSLGGDDCPVSPGLFDYVKLYTSATLTAVDLIVEENANVVFNPLGGFHHASRSHAEGFCYVNDAIVAIDAFLAQGYRVAYVDIDAHHGNGVQDAYYKDDRVLFVSLHESGKTLYPYGGFETEIGEDIGKGFNINTPLPQETDDEAYKWIFDRIVSPAVKKFAPSVVVAVVGADSHRNDPLSSLSLTNNGMVSVVEQLRDFSKHLLLLAGGGYNLQTVSRAWCRMWATANRIDALPDYLTVLGGSFMGSEGLQGAEIVDMNYRVSGAKKDEIMKELERIALYHEKNTIPRIGKKNGN